MRVYNESELRGTELPLLYILFSVSRESKLFSQRLSSCGSRYVVMC